MRLSCARRSSGRHSSKRAPRHGHSVTDFEAPRRLDTRRPASGSSARSLLCGTLHSCQHEHGQPLLLPKGAHSPGGGTARPLPSSKPPPLLPMMRARARRYSCSLSCTDLLAACAQRKSCHPLKQPSKHLGVVASKREPAGACRRASAAARQNKGPDPLCGAGCS